MDFGATEALHVRTLLEEMGLTTTVRLRTDASSVEAILLRLGPGRLKHIEIKQQWLQEQVREGKVVVERVTTDLNVADIFTKLLSRNRFQMLRQMLNLGP